MPPIKKAREGNDGKEAGQRGRGRARKRASPEPQGGGGKRQVGPKRVGGGNPVMAQANAQAAEMTDYYNTLKKRREAERAHAIANDLVDDPNKQRRLEDAIVFRGTCTEMCAEFERVERIVQRAVDACEKVRGEDGAEVASQPHMVKRFRRSAAGDEAQLPSDVRTPSTLRRTLDYLMDDVVGGSRGLVGVHAFVWDRTRSIRNDFTLQNVEGFETADLQIAIECYEIIARFHIHVLHEMARPNRSATYEFVAYNEREQLNKTLMSLVEFYDIGAARGIESPNEAEFRSYRVILHLNNPHVEREVLALAEQRPEIFNHAQMQLAMELYELATNSHELEEYPGTPLVFPIKLHQFFERIKSDGIGYTMACMAEIHFNVIRKNALTAMRDANNADLSSKHCTLAVLVELFGFDVQAEAEEFGMVCGMTFAEGERKRRFLELGSGPRPLLNPNEKLSQPFSKILVECKRGGRTLPQAIHGATVQEVQEGRGEEQESEDQAAAAEDTTTSKMTDTTVDAAAQPPAARRETDPPRGTSQQRGFPLFVPQESNPSPATSKPSPFPSFPPQERNAPSTTSQQPSFSLFAQQKPNPPAATTQQPSSSLFVPQETNAPPTKPQSSGFPLFFQQETNPPPVKPQQFGFPSFVPQEATQPPSTIPKQSNSPFFMPQKLNPPTSQPSSSPFFVPSKSDAQPAASQPSSFSLFAPKEPNPAPATSQSSGFSLFAPKVPNPPPATSAQSSSPFFAPPKPTASQPFSSPFFAQPTSNPPPAASQQPGFSLFASNAPNPAPAPSQSGFPLFVPQASSNTPAIPQQTGLPSFTLQEPSPALALQPEPNPPTASQPEPTAAPREPTRPPQPAAPREPTPPPRAPTPPPPREPTPPPLELPREVVSFITTSKGGLLDQLVQHILPSIVEAAEAEHDEELARDFRRHTLSQRYGRRWRYIVEQRAARRRGLASRKRMRQFILESQQRARDEEEKKKRKSDMSLEERLEEMARAKRRQKEREVATEVVRLHEHHQRHREQLRSRAMLFSSHNGQSLPNGRSGTSVTTSRPLNNHHHSSSLSSTVPSASSLQRNMTSVRKAPALLSGHSILDNAIRQGIPPELARASMRDTVRSDFWRLKAAGLEKLPNGIVQPIGMPGGGGTVSSSRSRSTSSSPSSLARPSSAAAVQKASGGPRKRSFEDLTRSSTSPSNDSNNNNNDDEEIRPPKRTSVHRSPELLPNGVQPSIHSGSDTQMHIPSFSPSRSTSIPNDEQQERKKKEEDEEEAALFAKVRALNKAMDEDIAFYREEIQKEELRRRSNSGSGSQMSKSMPQMKGEMMKSKTKPVMKREDMMGLSKRQVEWLTSRRGAGAGAGAARFSGDGRRG